MARSTYIYLVVDRNGDGVALPVFAGTVRYELVGWLGRRADWVRAEVRKRETVRLVDLLHTPTPPSFATLHVYRMRDGNGDVEPVLLGTAAQVLAEPERIEKREWQGRPA